MNYPCILVSMAVLLGACSGGSPSRSDGPRILRFNCENGETMEMRFIDDAVVLAWKDGTVQLRQQPSGAGLRYTNGPIVVPGKGIETIGPNSVAVAMKGKVMMVELGRMPAFKCTSS